MDDLPDEPVYNMETSSPNASWNMYFDGATRTNEKGKPISEIGILFVSPNKYMIPHAFSLLEPCSNNAAEYQALIIGLELALEYGITMLEAFGDSQLIVNQMNQKYESGSLICCLTTTRRNRFVKGLTSVTSPTSAEVKTFMQMPWLDLLHLWQSKKGKT